MTEASRQDIERIAKPGDVLAGKYLVERLLGVGGMGAVVAATHTQLDQRVAIKFLLPSMMANREVVERFQREARAAAKIRSEHVVRVSDVGTLDGGVPYIVMEFLEGGDLGDLLARRGPLPVRLAIDYILEAVEALAEAHAAGIVHRDLKPGNLFLARRPDDSEIIKVLDFGISKQLAPDTLQSNPSLTKTTDVFGSPTYMSPEQLKASRDVDMRADVWALGVILYELLAGQPPFGGGTVAEIFGAILHKPAPRIRTVRKDVPADVERVLLHCLEKEVSARFQNVGELADALAPHGSDGARESTARVLRVLRTSGGYPRASRPSAPGGRASLPGSSPAIEVPAGEAPDGSRAVQASTALGSDKGGSRPGEPARAHETPGSSTNTSWGHVRPAQKKGSGRIALVAGGALAAAAVGAFVVLKLLSSGPPAGSGTQAASPTAETLPATSTPVASTIVTPAPTTASPAAPSTTADAAPTPTVTPATPATATPAGTTPPKGTGKPAPTGTPSTAAPTPTTPPAATPDPPKTAPQGGGDDDFGGRR